MTNPQNYNDPLSDCTPWSIAPWLYSIVKYFSPSLNSRYLRHTVGISITFLRNHRFLPKFHVMLHGWSNIKNIVGYAYSVGNKVFSISTVTTPHVIQPNFRRSSIVSKSHSLTRQPIVKALSLLSQSQLQPCPPFRTPILAKHSDSLIYVSKIYLEHMEVTGTEGKDRVVKQASHCPKINLKLLSTRVEFTRLISQFLYHIWVTDSQDLHPTNKWTSLKKKPLLHRTHLTSFLRIQK